MGKKMLVALMMEGKFSGEGLQALDTDEDLMSAMARELVEKAGVGESADAVWRDLGHEREKMLPRPAAVEPEPEEKSDLPGLIVAEPARAPFGIHLIEPNQLSKKGKKTALWPTANQESAQLSLFDREEGPSRRRQRHGFVTIGVNNGLSYDYVLPDEREW
jgi:hypothetical protein